MPAHSRPIKLFAELHAVLPTTDAWHPGMPPGGEMGTGCQTQQLQKSLHLIHLEPLSLADAHDLDVLDRAGARPCMHVETVCTAAQGRARAAPVGGGVRTGLAAQACAIEAARLHMRATSSLAGKAASSARAA